MSVLSLMPLSGLNMRIPSSVPLPICTLSINAAPWCLVGSIVCLGMKLGLNHDPTTQLSDVVSSASGGCPHPPHQMIPTCHGSATEIIVARHVIPIARTCPSPPPRPLSKPFLQTTDSACGGATPGPVESEDRRIADGSSASSAVRLMHRASSYGPVVMNRPKSAFIRSKRSDIGIVGGSR
ncbi:hypothetical protein BGW80DRAFT_668307 [Lactifluus volemus]|nr:hypothetical protein BGW80DRAFT_668307 [Lactifluus volemus]